MKKPRTTELFASAALAALAGLVLLVGPGREEAPTPTAAPPQGEVSVLADPWAPSFPLAVADARSAGKPLFVLVGAEWCGPCKRLKQWLAGPDLATELTRFVCVEVDYDNQRIKDMLPSSPPAFGVFVVGDDVAQPFTPLAYSNPDKGDHKAAFASPEAFLQALRSIKP